MVFYSFEKPIEPLPEDPILPESFAFGEYTQRRGREKRVDGGAGEERNS